MWEQQKLIKRKTKKIKAKMNKTVVLFEQTEYKVACVFLDAYSDVR